MATLTIPFSTGSYVSQSGGATGDTAQEIWDKIYPGTGDGSGTTIKSGWTENSSYSAVLYRGLINFGLSSLDGITITGATMRLSGTPSIRNYNLATVIGSAPGTSFSSLKTTTDYGTLPVQASPFTDVDVTLNAAAITAINSGSTIAMSTRCSVDATGLGTTHADSYTYTTITAASLIVEYTLDPPTVTTQSASSVEETTATLNGNITATGGADATTQGFYWLQGTTGTPTSANNVASSTGTFGTGAFTEGLTGLTANTSYRYVAFATNSAGTTVGTTVVQFTTDTTPTVTTQDVSAINKTTATLNGNMTASGGDNATGHGFYLKAGTGTPTSSDTVISETGDFSTGAFTLGETGLTEDTLYSVVAFATNSVGTSTGSTVEFTTSKTAVVRNPNMGFFLMFT